MKIMWTFVAEALSPSHTLFGRGFIPPVHVESATPPTLFSVGLLSLLLFLVKRY